MALDPRVQDAIALNRFGLSRKGSAPAVKDARAALLADLDDPAAGQIASADLMDAGAAFRAAFQFRQERRAARRASAAADKDVAEKAMAGNDMEREAARRGPGVPQKIYLQEAKARLEAALKAQTGFVERLVWFWSNHFCVSADKGAVRPLCGAFEREAIRPHVRGKFADMLLAVETHPAMLLYLDNARSMGPDFAAGRRQHKGLNENLAREIMELHTVGVRTGYSQADVTNFAKVITGWSIVPPRRDDGGAFTFKRNLHEPGPQQVMGQVYGEKGFEQGRAVLLMLARSPATAHHIATKLARHFVADTPPPSLVERLAKRFTETDGDLKQVSHALVTAPEVWEMPAGKLRRPSDWIVAALRALESEPDNIRPLLNAEKLLGEPLWRPPAPNGFSDDSGAWMAGIAERVDIANLLARRSGTMADPKAMAERALGPLLSAETRQTVARAETPQQAIAMLLMAPEFQRR